MSTRATTVLVCAAALAVAMPAFAQQHDGVLAAEQTQVPKPAPPVTTQKPTTQPPRAPREPIGFRAFVSFDMVALAAADSFDAALGTSSMTAVGGGGEVLNLWKGLFARVGVSSMSDTGTRVAIVDDDIFDLEIPLDVKMRTIEFGGGWRYVRRARPRRPGGHATSSAPATRQTGGAGSG